MIARIISFFLLLLWGKAIIAYPAVQPGQVLKLPLENITSSQSPRAYFRGERVMVIATSSKTAWEAWIGIPLKIKPGKYQLDVEIAKNKTREFPFQVQGKTYQKQYLAIQEKKYVDPPASHWERLKRERAQMQSFYRTWRETENPALSFILPVRGRFSAQFGLQRYFNQKPRNPHSGLDIAAPEGTPIVAAAEGVVVGVGDYFFNGKSVFVEHGQGVVTMYCHLSAINVEADQHLKQGEQLGLVGKTGRVTGAHLHWSVSLNNARVDPLWFVAGDEKK